MIECLMYSIFQTGFSKSPQGQAHCQPRVIVSGSVELPPFAV